MAISCPPGLDAQLLRSEVSSLYSRVASEPDGDFHFHRGAGYAAEFLGYDAAELAELPPQSPASFAGVGNPHRIGDIQPGETVLDVGCGAGMDLLLAARRTGREGRAIGVDMTESMANRTREAARSADLPQAEVRLGDFTALPVEDESIDVLISNGVLNLVPEKERALAEILRVLKPGGRLQLADIALDMELSEDIREDIDLWTG